MNTHTQVDSKPFSIHKVYLLHRAEPFLRS